MQRGVPLPACVSLVRGETVKVGQKKHREGAWGIVRVVAPGVFLLV